MIEFTIYVTGGADYFYAALNGIASIFSHGGLLLTVALTGALLALAGGAWHIIQRNLGSGLLRSHSWIEHAIVMTLVVTFCTVPTRVTVQDVYGNQTAIPVDNVPLIFSFPTALFSGIGYTLFETIDTGFQSVQGSYMSVSQEGFATPLKLLFAMRGGLQQTSPDLTQSYQQFLLYCTLNSGITDAGRRTSPDLAAYLVNNGRNEGLTYSYIGPTGATATSQGEVVSCSEAKSRIRARMARLTNGGGAGQSDIDRLLNYNVKDARVGSGATTGYTYQDYEGAYNSLLGASGQNAQQFMQTALIRNLVNDTYRCFNANTSNASFANCTQLQSDAMEQYKIDATAGASLFTKTMFPAMGLLQVLFLAFGGVVILYGLLEGAAVASALAKYAKFGIWVFSWLPFVAIINAFIQWMVTDKLAQVQGGALTMESYSTYMYDVLSSNLAMASDMLAATPLITYGLLTGSAYAVASYANRLSARDNVDETQAAPQTSTVAPGMQVTSTHTSNAYRGEQSSDYTPVTYKASEAASMAEKSAFTQSVQSKMDVIRSADTAVSSTVSQLSGTTVTNSDAMGQSSSRMTGADVALSAANSLGAERGVGSNVVEAVQESITAGLKGGVSTPGKASVGVGGGYDATFQDRKDFSEADKRAAKDLLNDSVSQGEKYAKGAVASAQDQVVTRGGTLGEDARSASESFKQAVSRSEASSANWERAQQRVEQYGASRDIPADVLGQSIREDSEQGTGGNGWAQRIHEAYRGLVAGGNGASIDKMTRDNESILTRNGKSNLPAQQELAMLETLRRHNSPVYGEVVSEAAGFNSIAGASDVNRGIGARADGVQVDGRNLGAGVPGAGLARASGIRSADQQGAVLQRFDGRPDMGVAGGMQRIGNEVEVRGASQGVAPNMLQSDISSRDAINRQQASRAYAEKLYQEYGGNSPSPVQAATRGVLADKAGEAWGTPDGVRSDLAKVMEREQLAALRREGRMGDDGGLRVDISGVLPVNQLNGGNSSRFGGDVPAPIAGMESGSSAQGQNLPTVSTDAPPVGPATAPAPPDAPMQRQGDTYGAVAGAGAASMPVSTGSAPARMEPAQSHVSASAGGTELGAGATNPPVVPQGAPTPPPTPSALMGGASANMEPEGANASLTAPRMQATASQFAASAGGTELGAVATNPPVVPQGAPTPSPNPAVLMSGASANMEAAGANASLTAPRMQVTPSQFAASYTGADVSAVATNSPAALPEASAESPGRAAVETSSLTGPRNEPVRLQADGSGGRAGAGGGAAAVPSDGPASPRMEPALLPPTQRAGWGEGGAVQEGTASSPLLQTTATPTHSPSTMPLAASVTPAAGINWGAEMPTAEQGGAAPRFGATDLEVSTAARTTQAFDVPAAEVSTKSTWLGGGQEIAERPNIAEPSGIESYSAATAAESSHSRVDFPGKQKTARSEVAPETPETPETPPVSGSQGVPPSNRR